MNANQQPAARPNPAAQQPVTTEYSIRVPKDNKKKHHVMKFNGNLKIDFKDWKGRSVKMERENNMRNFRELDEDAPKFGAGSEFGREAREEARRKKYGVASKQYKPEDQPWLLKLDGKNGRKFKGTREGGVSQNASYYIFTHGANGIIEAFPLKDWYNFQPVQRYKALSAEEAEEEFSRRNKVMNYFNLMFKKRLRNEEEEGEEADLENEKGKKPGKKNKDFKISEMDDWIDDDDDDNSDNSDKDGESGDDDGKKNNNKKKGAQKKKKKRASDSEAFEESDDGDEEGRECDYISDSSASESDLENQKEMKSVAEEDALRKLLASDEEEEEDEEKKDDEDKNEEDEEEGKEKDEKDKDKAGKSKDKSKDKKKKDGSDSSSEGESGAAPNKDDKKPLSTQSSRSATPTAAGPSSSTDSLKRPAPGTSDLSPAKKVKIENNYALASSSNSGESRTITEDAVRRYLMRKPMTARELCQKFKRKSGLSSDELVDTMTKILRNINPTSQKIKEKTYFSIKTDPKQLKPQNN